MALPTSGPIWISQLRDEFGNWGPPNYMSHYYAGGGLVPPGYTGQNGAIPSSGYVSLWHFYGAARYPQMVFGNYGTSYGYIEGSFGSLTPNVTWPWAPYRIILFYWTNGVVYLDVDGYHPNSGWTNIDAQGYGGYNRASAAFSQQGGYTRWRWNAGNPFGAVGAGTRVVVT